MNLLRRDTSTKAGIKIRRLKAATSDPYRTELLGWQGSSCDCPVSRQIALQLLIQPYPYQAHTAPAI